MSVDKGAEGFVIEAPTTVTGTDAVSEEEAVWKEAVETPASKKHSKKKKKRTRGQKRTRNLVVLRAGDVGATRSRLHAPSQTRLDLPVTGSAKSSKTIKEVEFSAVENERLPWKTRRIMAMRSKGGREITAGKHGTENGTNDKEDQDEVDGQREGETDRAYKKRVREEAASARKELMRGGPGCNRQKEKKRAYYERKKERAQRRKRRKRVGNRNDSDGENDCHDEKDANGHTWNGGFWAEMLKERLESSEKSRKLRHRDRNGDGENARKSAGDGGEREYVPFGEVVQRPPTLTKPLKR